MNLDFVAILKKNNFNTICDSCTMLWESAAGNYSDSGDFSLDLLSWQYYQLKLKRRKMRTAITRAYNNQHHDQSAVRVLKSQLTYTTACFGSLKSRIIEEVLYLSV